MAILRAVSMSPLVAEEGDSTAESSERANECEKYEGAAALNKRQRDRDDGNHHGDHQQDAGDAG